MGLHLSSCGVQGNGGIKVIVGPRVKKRLKAIMIAIMLPEEIVGSETNLIAIVGSLTIFGPKAIIVPYSKAIEGSILKKLQIF